MPQIFACSPDMHRLYHVRQVVNTIPGGNTVITLAATRLDGTLLHFSWSFQNIPRTRGRRRTHAVSTPSAQGAASVFDHKAQAVDDQIWPVSLGTSDTRNR